MLPLKTLSSTPVIGNFLYPDNSPFDPLIDYEMGGVGLNDSSQGLEVQTWKAQVTSTGISVSAPNTSAVEILTIANVTSVALAFDQNMRPHLAYTVGNNAYLWWYDSVAQAMATMQLPAGVGSPRLCLDDKRHEQIATSDILLFYIVGSQLYFCAQRDRFGIAYVLGAVSGTQLQRIGLSNLNRLQIEVI